MPVGDQAFLNDLARLRTILDNISASANISAESIRTVNAELRLISAGRFRSEQQLQAFIANISELGVSANISAQQLRDLNRVAREVGAFARVQPAGQFGGGPLGLGRNITLGQRGGDFPTLESGKPDFQQILGQPGVLQRIPGGAKALENMKVQLAGVGAELSDLSEIYIDNSRGLVRWTANVKGVPGAVNRAVVVTDKWGGIMRSTQKQFRSFGSAVARDIGEIAKWGIAAAVVYAPVRALGDLVRETTELQNKLADAQIALGASQETLNVVWEDASNVARELGVDVSGVVEGYVLAFRATGNITNPTERANKATGLLRDSMLLAKLANIDQAKALDTLVGALRQTNTPLDEGVTILDKWVAVSKVANVSIATLAESFAITATAAENVGLSIDELNGFIAAVAEVTTLSATESGNAVRAFISGFQTEKAEDQLRRFGISVRDTRGELRTFNEVIEDIVSRRDVGLISDRELAKISEVIGGGARRGAQVNAFLRNYSRVQDLAAVSANANGDAADALAIKMDTLQSALVNMKNAFSELARATGSEGGFLELITSGVQGLTALADILSKVISLLGDATPAIIALTVAMVAFQNNSRLINLTQGLLGRTVIPSGAGPSVGPQGVLPGFESQLGVPPLSLGRRALGFGGGIAARLGAGRGTTFGDLTRTTVGRGAGGAATGAILALGDVTGEDKNLARAGITIAASIGGALIAGPAGAIVGGAIAQAFISDLEANATSIALTMARAREGTLGVAVDLDPQDIEGVTTEIEQVLRQTFGALYADTFLSTDITQPRHRRTVAEAAGVRDPDALTEDQVRDLVQEQILRAIAGEELPFDVPTTGVSGFGKSLFATALEAGEEDLELRERARAIIKALEEGLEEEAGNAEPEFTGIFNDMLNASLARTSPVTKDLFAEELRERRTATGRGELGVRQLREFQSLQGSIGNQVNLVATALATVNDERLTEVELVTLILDLEEEERNLLVDLSNELGRAIEKQEELVALEHKGVIERGLEAEATADVLRLQKQLNDETQALASSRIYREFEPASIIRLEEGADVDQFIADVIEAQDKVRNALTLDPDEQQKIIDSYEEVLIRLGEGFDDFELRKEKLDLGIAAEVAKEQGIAFEAQQLPIQVLDIDLTQFENALSRLPFYEDLVRALRPLEDEMIGFITSDDQTRLVEHTDSLAIQLLLRDIKELNEEQLEGIFNIPDGVVASIPFTGQLYFSTEPINRQDVAELTSATTGVEDAVDTQTDILHGDLVNLESGLRREEAVLTPEQIEQRRRELAADAAAQDVVDPRAGAYDPSFDVPLPPNYYDPSYDVPLPPEGGLPSLGDWLEQTGVSQWFDDLVNLVAPSSVGQFPGVVEEPIVAAQDEPIPVTFDGEEILPADPRFDDAKKLQDLQQLQELLLIQQEQEAIIAAKEQTPDFGVFQPVFDLFDMLFGAQTAEAAGLPQAQDPRAISGTLGLGATTGLGSDVQEVLESTLPQSIPVTVNTRITNPVTVLVDGKAVADAVEERYFQDLGGATRRAGALGYVQE